MRLYAKNSGRWYIIGSMDTDYRMVRTKDAALLLNLLLEAAGDIDNLPQSPVEISDIEVPDAEAVIQASSRTSVLAGAFSEGRMLGMCSIVPMMEVRRKHCGEMYLVVRKEFWNRGLSTHLVNYAIDMAAEKGLRKISVSVADSSEGAKAFLEEVGFHSEGRNERMLSVDGKFIDGERFAMLID